FQMLLDCPYGIILLSALVILMLAYAFNGRARFEIRCFLMFLTILFTSLISLPFCSIASYFGHATSVVLSTLRICSKWTGIKVEVRNFDEFLGKQDSSCVVICNHQSAIDTIVVAHSYPSRCTVMMKKSLAFVPFFNVVAWLCNAIFVDRAKAMGTVEQCTEAMKKKNLKLWVFPEGTRNRSLDGLLPFKKGAFNIAVEAQIPIVPVVASSFKCFYSHTEKYFYGDGEIIAQVMEPILTTGLTRDDVPTLTEEVREKMLVVYEKITGEINERMTLKRGEKKQQ
ncbi:hypothetical protein PMAYCL1PPCAC_30272, partial [Pristionchus mayeri]